MPLISVLMPVYNGEKYLREAIQSVLDQSFSDFELIIVDDGSSDNSQSVVHSFVDKRIKYFKKNSNSGLIDTLNFGVSLCSCEYIARFDQDDRMMEKRLEKQVGFLKAHTQIDIVGSNIKFMGRKEIGRYPRTNVECKAQLFCNSCFAHPAVMIRKTVFKKYKYSKEYFGAEDLGLWAEAAYDFEFYNIQECLIHYRLHESQMSSVYFNEQQNSRKKIVDRYIRKCFGDLLQDKDVDNFIRIMFSNVITIDDYKQIRHFTRKLESKSQKKIGEATLRMILPRLWIFDKTRYYCRRINDYLKINKKLH